MDFLRECASRLDEGEPASYVLKDMKSRFTTVRCMNVKTSLVRKMCKLSEDYIRARDLACIQNPEMKEDIFRGTSNNPCVREVIASLPERTCSNVAQLRITRNEMIECKRLGIQSTLRKNRFRVRVNGRQLLDASRRVLEDVGKHRFALLAFAIMLGTGRRTCEVLNGSSRFDLIENEPYALKFYGAAKRRGKRDATMWIPTILRADDLLRAIAELRRRQGHQIISNELASLRYQSLLARELACSDVWKQCPKVHSLRGLYCCMALRLFRWNESDAFVAMSILGHAGLTESLVYTPFHIGDDFSSEPMLGTGKEFGEEEEGPL